MSRPSKAQRVLACVLCQQRKVRCDRKFPCANCIKSRVQCVTASAHKQRKPRFPERDLLDRICRYEQLLSQNNIPFEPLHKDPAKEHESLDVEISNDSDEATRLTPSTTVRSESNKGLATKNVWHAMSRGFRDPIDDGDSSNDDMREIVVKKAFDQSAINDDHLLFGSSRSLDLSTLHPDPVQIFRLWQIYLDNVNPLLKVTHTPSLQGRLIDAAANVANINPVLEALMFGIYSMSILSLAAEECQTMFGSSKESLLTSYQLGCRQALSNSGFLRTTDRECLTAFYLYLVSVKSITAPQSLSSMLGIAVRIAQRMGIHSESTLTQCTVVEAEMRRRLWWSLALFDCRVCETLDLKDVLLNPTWNCSLPRNVNDSDLRPSMKEPPAVQRNLTDALFAVVRSDMGDFVRHAEYYLDFTNPAMKHIAKHLHNGVSPDGSDVLKFEKMIEDRHLRLCDPENPLHFMTIWTARAHLAKARLMEHHARYSDSAISRTDEVRDAATSYAIRMLECDTMVMTSPLTKGFRWLNHSYFPFPAYYQVSQDLRIRPSSAQAGKAWKAMSSNYEAWAGSQPGEKGSLLLLILAKMVLQAWDAFEALPRRTDDAVAPPKMVSLIRDAVAQMSSNGQNNDGEPSNAAMDMAMDDLSMTQSPLSNENLPYSNGMQDNPTMMTADIYPGMTLSSPFGVNMNQMGWSTSGGWPGWGGY